MSQYGVEYSPISCGVGRAKQSMRDECDVNLIMAKFVKTGFVSHLSKGLPSFTDVSELTDYRSAIEHVRSVELFFAGLPPAVRSRFENDAVSFMSFLEEGGSAEDLEAIGRDLLGDRRSRRPSGREGDVAPVVTPPAAPVAPPEAGSTLPT